MHMYHFNQYTHTALSAAYDTVYTCPMGRLQRWCMYLVVCDAVLVIKNNNNLMIVHQYIYMMIRLLHCIQTSVVPYLHLCSCVAIRWPLMPNETCFTG